MYLIGHLRHDEADQGDDGHALRSGFVAAWCVRLTLHKRHLPLATKLADFHTTWSAMLYRIYWNPCNLADLLLITDSLGNKIHF